MAYEPNGKIYLGRVPWDASYSHVRYFAKAGEEQIAYMVAHCDTSFSREDYTYQRVDNAVVVPWNAEMLYSMNYCMFQNATYGNRWFYSFITRVEYVNPNSTRLYLSTDIMQTWLPQCTVPPCLVEREHVNDDTLGANLIDEGLNPGEAIVADVKDDGSSGKMYAFAASAVKPKADGTYQNVSGGGYQNVWSGSAIFCMKENGELNSFMNALSDNGQQDAISDVYMAPDYVVGNLLGDTVPYNEYAYEMPRGGGAVVDEVSLSFDIGELDGYTPKNNKTLLFPNQYLEANNQSGGIQNFRFEFFENPGTATFERWTGFLPQSSVAFMPTNYNGREGKSPELAVSLGAYPTLPWVYQTYANMYGQAQVEMLGGLVKFNSLTDLPAMETAKGVAEKAAGVVGDVGTLMVGAKAKHADAGQMASSTGSLVNFAADATLDVMKYKAQISKAERTPNTARGGLNGSTSAANFRTYQMKFIRYTCRAEYARRIDDYYSVCGYQVSEVKKPNLTGRRSWNYVKTSGCNVQGNVPVEAKTQINAILDRGVTFWHTDKVGDYSQDNSIV